MMATGATAHESMDVQVELSVKNDGWGATVLNEMDALRESGHTCDMALMATDGSTVRAHSGVLSAASSIFKDVLQKAKQSSSSASDIVIKATFTHEVVAEVIDFLYKGTARPYLSQIPEIKRAAQVFGISSLLSLCDICTSQSYVQASSTTVSHAPDPGKQHSGVSYIHTSNLNAETAQWQSEVTFNNELPVVTSDDDDNDDDPGYLQDSTMDGDRAIDTGFTEYFPVKTTGSNKTPRPKGVSYYDDEKRAERAAKRRQYKYNCDFCPRIFDTKCRMESHRATHSGEKLHKCDICDKRFVQAYGLRQHMFSHSDEKPFKCDECDKSYPTLRHLKQHSRLHIQSNLVERPHKCDSCEKCFQTIQLLKKHSRCHHTVSSDGKPSRKPRKKQFRCPKCWKSCRTASILEDHKGTHSADEKFKCDDCGNEFSSRKNVWAHKKKNCIHRNDKTQRQKKWPQKDPPGNELSEGTAVTSERRYVCNREGCPGKFRLPAQIRRHIRLYHGDSTPINVRDFVKTVDPKPSGDQIENS